MRWRARPISLTARRAALVAFKKELSDDPIIRNHLAALYDTLLESNLVRVIEPYSRVEIAFIAESVKQPTREVEAKLSQMILVRGGRHDRPLTPAGQSLSRHPRPGRGLADRL